MDLVSLIVWVLFGALVGWIASKVMDTDAQQGAVANIVVGIIGALLGGWLYTALFEADVDTFTIGGFIVSLIGAVILLAAYKAFSKRA